MKLKVKIEELITEVQKRVQDFELLKDKLTIFTFDKITAQKIQLCLINQQISSFYFQVQTFEDLIHFFLKQNKNQNRIFYLLKIKELIQKENHYKFSSKVSLKLSRTIYENLEKQIDSDLSTFPQLKCYLQQEKFLSSEQFVSQQIHKMTKEKMEHLRFTYGETFIFWTDKQKTHLKPLEFLFHFLDKNFQTTYFFPLEQEPQPKEKVDYWEFLDIEKEILTVYHQIIHLIQENSLSPEKIQVVLPFDEDFLYLNLLNNLFKRQKNLSFFYSRNNQLRINSYIATVISLIGVCSSEFDYKTVFSLFYSPCFQPHFLKTFQPELWNEILTKIPIEQFLDRKQRKEKQLRPIDYGTWIHSIKQLVLNFIKEEHFFLNQQEKKEMDNLLLGVFSFLQDILFFQNQTLTFGERTHFFQTLLNTYLSTTPRTIQLQELDDKILKENQFAQERIFSILNHFKESSVLDQKIKSQDWTDLFLSEIHLFFQELNSAMDLQGNVFVSHIQDNLSIKYDVTFFCGFNQLNYTLDEKFYFEQKVLHSKKTYFTYTSLDKNSEPILPSNLVYSLEDSVQWEKFEVWDEIEPENKNIAEKELFRSVIPSWEDNTNFPSLENVSLKNIDKQRLKNQFVKSKLPIQKQTETKIEYNIQLGEIIKYLRCPHQFELHKNFSLKTEKELYEKENFIQPFHETLFYRKFIPAVIEKKLKKKHIKVFLEKEIFNETNLSTQKVPWGVLREVLCEEWKTKLTSFYHLLEDNLSFLDCELDKEFENLQFHQKKSLEKFSFFYQVELFEKQEKIIKIYKMKRSSTDKTLVQIELSIFSYLIEKLYPNFRFELYLIAFKENKILFLQNKPDILNNIYKILDWFLNKNRFFVIPFTENVCSYCNLSHVCFGKNFAFQTNKEYSDCISELENLLI